MFMFYMLYRQDDGWLIIIIPYGNIEILKMDITTYRNPGYTYGTRVKSDYGYSFSPAEMYPEYI